MVKVVSISNKEDNIRKLWMPLKKSIDTDNYQAILSDSSIDRDYERISPDLLRKWAETKALPALINHENKMEKLAGGWRNFRFIQKDGHYGLMADLYIFKSNPNTNWLKELLEEAEEFGIPIGVSISAIPKSHVDGNIEKDGYKRMWTDAELVEATLTPIPSNRNAAVVSRYKSYDAIAKQFDLDNYIENTKLIEKKVVKRGNKWCVIHCHGPDAGKPIKCFDTKEEALKMHRAIMANKNKEYEDELIEKKEKPPKEWWNRCMDATHNNAQLCGWIWYHRKKELDGDTISKILKEIEEEITMEDEKLNEQVEQPQEEVKEEVKEEPKEELKEENNAQEEKSFDIEELKEELKKHVENVIKEALKELKEEPKEEVKKENRKAELKGYFEENSVEETQINKSLSKEEYSLRDSLRLL